ncbi:MAG: tetratricopeptide repeat protein [Actinomycetota bacterium]|nr:tetratricopeptide repeat protein [Actinomycetota bacterium]
MTDLPSGTLTLLFSDIEGSTSLLGRLGDRYGDVLSAQRRIMRRAINEHSGHEMGTEGDSFFVVFESVADAVGAAYDAQRGLSEHPWPDGAQVRVRMGVHTGEPARLEDGYVGMDVHRAARVAGCAHGGQVLLSEATYRLAAKEAIDFVDLGWHRLKDIPEAEHLYQLAAAGLPREFPPPKSLGSRATLPIPPTPIVAREAELAEVTELITSPDVRLVTLSGPGGCGKTRLAIAAATTLENSFPDGIYFVPLEEVQSAEVMWTTIAEVLGTGNEGPAKARLLQQLANRNALLLLDNLEQVPQAADVVAELLAAAPKGAVLATSRRPLHLADEYEHPVPPLSLPRFGAEEDSGAVRLFLQRARMVRPGFSLTPENRAAVAEICRRLDGLPLAIELAASRVRLIGPRALLARLEASLKSPAARPGRPARQQTLYSTIAWSYGLLTDKQQAVFRRLGVLAGGGDLAAAAAVTGTDEDPLEVLADLVDVSLVQLHEDADGEPRLQVLQTIGGFAREQLAEAGELQEVRRLHAEHYLAVIGEHAPQLQSSRFLSIRDRIEIELDNLRAALTWTLGVDEPDRPAEDRVEIGLRLCQELSWFWYACGYSSEGRRWLARGAEAAAGRESSALMTTLHALGVALQQHGQNVQSRDLLLRCLEFWRREGNRSKITMELNSLACAQRALGETELARSLFEESIATAAAIGDDARRASALSNLAILEVDENHPARAVDLLRETLQIDQRLGDTWGVAHDHNNLAAAMVRAGQIAEAHTTLSENAAAAMELGDIDLSINLMETFCIVFAELGDAGRAARLLGATTALRRFVELPLAAPDAEMLEASIGKVRDLPDAQTWQANLEAGSDYSLEAALADALHRG